MINVEVTAQGAESIGSVLRKFNRKVQSSGVISKAKKIRYSSRPMSKYNKKRHALNTLKNRKELEKKIRLGKAVDRNSF